MTSFIPIESKLRKAGLNLIAGIDEAGIGPLAGPVVSAAVILKRNIKLPGLNSSKLISRKKRQKLFNLITKNSLDYAISIVSHLVIDRTHILEAVRFGNYLCIEYLKYTPEIALIDGRDKQYLRIPFQTIIGGDAKVRSIAAASILAKVTRDRIMEHYAEQYDKYRFEKHKGYGTREHRSLLSKYGPCGIHRKSYKLSI